MKKFLFTILTCFSVFLIAGCSDSDDDGPSVTAVDLANPSTLKGTYDVVFFATKPTGFGAAGTMSTDCMKAGELGLLTPVDIQEGDSVNAMGGECAKDGSWDAKFVSKQAVIEFSEETGAVIKTKLQLWHPVFTLSPNDVYQYTAYSAVPTENITSEGINMDGIVKGVFGRNLTTKTNNPDSDFKVTKMADGSLYIDLNLKGKAVDLIPGITIDAPTYVILKKTSDAVEVVKENELSVPSYIVQVQDYDEDFNEITVDKDIYADFVPEVE